MPEPNIQKIGKYEIQAELGQGGFGRVYRAFDPTVGRLVAIKILTTEGNPDLLTRFRNEATSAGNLRHKNIVTIYEFGEHNGQPFLVMEFLEGEDLLQVINSGRSLNLLEKMNIMDQVADGLGGAHRSGVVHRDVKPANIRLLPDGTVKIMDFGIARIKRDRDATRLTQQGDLIGTILYMSPEQFAGAEADALCDIFAFGVTYFELLTGKHPFGSADPRVVMFKITMEDPQPIRTLAAECPEGLEHILNRALHKDRELRYQSLAEFRADTAPLIFELQQDRARQLLADAQRLSSTEERQQALNLVHEALNLDPSNREARQLREDLQKQIQKDALHPRVEAMFETGQKQLESRSFAQAIQTLESALKLDQSHAGIRAAIETAREALQRSKDAARLAAAATADVKRGDWSGASEKASQAARLNPYNTEAKAILARVEKHIQDVLSEMDGLITQGELDSAIRGLAELAALDPASKEIERRLTDATASKSARDRIRAVLQEAQQHISQSQFSAAIELLTAALVDFRDEPSLLSLRSRAEDGLIALQRSESIQRTVRSAEALLQAARFDEALHEIESALETYPDDENLAKMRQGTKAAKAFWEHDLLVQRTVDECNRLRAESRFAESLETIQAGLRKCGEEPVLLELQRTVQREQEEQKRAEAVRRQTEEGRRLLQQGQPKQALTLLRSATGQYPEDQGLKQLLADAQQQLLDQERNEAIGKAVAQARGRAEKQDFEGAISILEKSLKSWPGEGLLADLLEQTRGAKALVERQRGVRDVAQLCEKLASGNRIAEALEAVRAGLRKYAAEPGLVEIEGRLEREFELQKRAAAVHEWTEEVRRLLERGQPDLAVEVLRKATSQYPDETGLQKLLAEAQEQVLAQQRRAAVKNVVREAQERVQQQDFKGAIDILEKALKSWTGESQLQDLLQKTRDAQRGHQELQRLAEEEQKRRQRAEAVRKRVEEGRRLLQQARLKEALEALQKAAIEYPEAEDLKQLLGEARKREAVERATGEAHVLAEKRDFQGAVRILEQALKSFPGESRLVELLAKTRDAQRIYEERRRAISDVVQQCERLAKGSRLADALEAVKAGLGKYPDEPVLVELHGRVLKERERQQRAETVLQRAEEGRRLLGQGRAKQAIELLQSASSQFPEEHGLKQLLAEAQKQLVAQQLRAAVENAAGEARGRVDRQDFEGAISILEQALKSWPGESSLIELLRKTRDAQAQATRLEVEKALTQAQALLREGRTEDAIALLRQKASKHPSERQLLDLLQNTEQELQRQQHERELESVRSQTEELLRQGRPEEALALIESRNEGPRFAELIARVRSALGAKQLQELLQRAAALRGEKRHAEALALVEQAISQFGAPRAAVDLKQDLQNEIDQQRRRHERQTAYARLLAIELQTQARPRKRILAKQAEEVRQIAAAYSADEAMALLADRVRQGIETALSAPAKFAWPSWKSTGIGVATALVTIGVVLVVFRATTAVQIPVEIRSDPQGVSVRVGDRTCVTPACRFDLPTGTYQVEARLNGYQTIQQTMTIDGKKPSGALELTMQPLPAAPQTATSAPAAPGTPAPQPPLANGTLIVRAGISEALVFVDNVPRGRTDARGVFSLPLEATTHQVRVERTGYQTPREQQVRITSNSSQSVALKLTPLLSRLELRGAPAGIEVRIGTTLLGRTDGSGAFSEPVPPGDQTLQITEGSERRSIAQKFEPGQAVTLDWQNVAPPKPQRPPASPQPPDPKQIEAQDWERVRTSNNVDSIDDFIRRHSDGAHVEEARARAAQLRQQTQAAAARQAEQSAWDATDKGRKAALQDFISRYPNSPRVQDARGLIAGIDKQEADALAAQRAKEQRDKELAVASRAATEEQAITKIVGAYEAAYNARDLKALQGIWSGMPKATADAIGSTLKNARSITFQLRPLGRPEVNGSLAQVNCARSLSVTVPGQRIPTAADHVKVTLERTSEGWVIRTMTPY